MRGSEVPLKLEVQTKTQTNKHPEPMTILCNTADTAYLNFKNLAGQHITLAQAKERSPRIMKCIKEMHRNYSATGALSLRGWSRDGRVEITISFRKDAYGHNVKIS